MATLGAHEWWRLTNRGCRKQFAARINSDVNAMETNESELASHFRQMNDEELISRCGSQSLTELARTIALRELTSRGLTLPDPMEPEYEEDVYEGDYETVAQFLNQMDAHIVCTCLQSVGIRAYVADANLVQTNAL